MGKLKGNNASVKGRLAWLEHERVLAFFSLHPEIMNVPPPFFSAMEGGLYHGGRFVRSPDLVFIGDGEPNKWYSVELKNGIHRWNLEDQIADNKRILDRAGVLPVMISISHYDPESEYGQGSDYAYSIMRDLDVRTIRRPAPTTIENLLGRFEYTPPKDARSEALKNFQRFPKLLNQRGHLYSVMNGTLYDANERTGIDILFVDEGDPLHWTVVLVQDPDYELHAEKIATIAEAQGIRTTMKRADYSNCGWTITSDGETRHHTPGYVELYIQRQRDIKAQKKQAKRTPTFSTSRQRPYRR